MKKAVITTFLMLIVLLAEAQESQTAFNFLRLPVSAHAAALGGDNITLNEDDGTMLFHNPALAAEVSDKTLSLGMMTYMQGTATASGSFLKAAGERGTWAASAQYMSYGTMRETTAEGLQTGEFSAKDIAVMGTYAYLLTDHVSGGISAKVITSHIGQFHSLAMGVDLGLHYFSGEQQWAVAVVARNVGGQLTAYENDFERMPFDLQFGVSKRLVGSPLRLSATLVRLNDWEYGLGRHLVVGADLILSPQFYVAVGYNTLRAAEMRISHDDGDSSHGAGLSLGGGLQLERLKLHVAWAKYHVSSSSLLVNVSYAL